MNEPTLNQNFNNFIQNNNPGFPSNNFQQQNINPEFSLNNQDKDYFPNKIEKRINLTFEINSTIKYNLSVLVNTTINDFF